MDLQNQTCKKINLKNNGSINHISTTTKKSNALFAELKSFIECIKLNKIPVVCETGGLRALEIAIKIQKIIETDKQ